MTKELYNSVWAYGWHYASASHSIWLCFALSLTQGPVKESSLNLRNRLAGCLTQPWVHVKTEGTVPLDLRWKVNRDSMVGGVSSLQKRERSRVEAHS